MAFPMCHSADWLGGREVASPRDEQKAIRLVLKQVLQDGEDWQGEPQSPDTRAALASQRMFDPLAAWDLERHLRPGTNGAFGVEEAIQTRPPRHDVRISSLWCKWDFVAERSACWFYLGLWLRNGQFAGFRFEPPERGHSHNYYHSQPCRTMCFGGTQVNGALALPERSPTWPLPARSSLHLLLCAIVSVRGMTGLQEIFKDNSTDSDSVLRQNAPIRVAFEEMMGWRVV